MKILVTGATGLIGRALSGVLKQEGHDVIPLRRGSKNQRAPHWDPETGAVTLDGSYEAVVHLAGESVVGRWTQAKKRRIYESRAQGTRLLSEALSALKPRPRLLLCASAIGYYGDRGSEWVSEASEAGTGFLADTTKAWERNADPAREAGIRVVHLRLGIVLSAQGGALAKLLLPFRLGLGGRTGDGRQYWSWVTLDDVLRAVLHLLKADELQGPFNLVSPNPVPNAVFAQTLAGVLHRPAFFPLPSFVVRAIFGQMGEEMFLASCRVRPARLVDSGFSFKHAELENALRDLLKR
jgi:uncharacterized protein (TIGR01777 family)